MAQTSVFSITEFFIFLQVQHLTNLPTISQSIRQLPEFTEKICGPKDKTLIPREQARHFFVRFAPGKIPQKNLSGKVSRNPTHSWTKANNSDTLRHRPSIPSPGGPRIQSALSGNHPEPTSPPGFRQGGADAPPCPSGCRCSF